MIRRLRLADHRGREAVVALLPMHANTNTYYHGPDGQPVQHRRRIKCAVEQVYPPGSDPDDISRALIDGDPDVALELTGRVTGPCERRWMDREGSPCYTPTYVDVRYHPDGTERERRPSVMRPANLVTARPRVWSGMLRPRADVIRTDIFTRAYQVAHTNGLEFNFLYDLAQYLHERAVMVRIGSGAHGTGILRCERNGVAYRGWLDGRTTQDGYLLVLYLTSGAVLTAGASECHS